MPVGYRGGLLREGLTSISGAEACPQACAIDGDRTPVPTHVGCPHPRVRENVKSFEFVEEEEEDAGEDLDRTGNRGRVMEAPLAL
jgi:hypothetical protein